MGGAQTPSDTPGKPNCSYSGWYSLGVAGTLHRREFRSQQVSWVAAEVEVLLLLWVGQ